MSTNRDFTEAQRFTQWWLWLVILGVDAIILYMVYKHFFTDQQVGSQPIPSFAIVLVLLSTVGVFILFLIMRLETRIDRTGVHIKYFPLVTRHYAWDQITHAEVVNYGFIGGWGVRLGTKYGTVYNVKGNLGLYLELKNGKRVCIGTQQPEVIKRYLEQRSTQKNDGVST